MQNTWKEILYNWKKGNILSYPKTLNVRFFFETSPCDENFINYYEEKFIPDPRLESLKQDYLTFESYIRKSKNRYVTSFPNLKGDSLLIIPIPRKKVSFVTIKEFIDNASIRHQKEFWKYTSQAIKKFIKGKEIIWISTHGIGIPYFHLRIDTKPKYYQTKRFIN